MHKVNTLFLYHFTRTLAQRLVAGVLRRLKKGRECSIQQKVRRHEVGPALEVFVEKGKVIAQGTRHRFNLAEILFGLRKVVEQWIERAGMRKFILGHCSGSNGGF